MRGQEVWVLPCRDPIGLSGFRHALHLGLPFELPPDVHTMEEAAALLRKRGTVLVDEGEEGEQLLLALLGKPRRTRSRARVRFLQQRSLVCTGDYGYAMYLDGRASSMLPVDFAQAHPDAAAALVGRRLWWPSNYEDVPGASPLERAYTQFGPTDADNEVLHLK